MKYLEEYEKYSVDEKLGQKLKTGLRKASDSVKKKATQIKNLSWEDIRSYGNKIWELTKREGKETKQAVNILRKMMAKKDVTEAEKKFLKEQSKDLVRILGTATLPMPITAILVALGKKYNFEVFPGNQEELTKQIEDEKKMMESLGWKFEIFKDDDNTKL